MKATEQYFPMVLFIMLHAVVLTFESVDGILQCDHSIESCTHPIYCTHFKYKIDALLQEVNSKLNSQLIFSLLKQN